jgi:ABC-2 type transport system permease protein
MTSKIVVGRLGALTPVLGLAIGYRRGGRVLAGIGLLVLFPLTLASNVFVASRTMPGRLQAVVRVNPVSHRVTAERGLLGGHAAASQVAWVLIAVAIMTAVFAPLTGWLCGRQR